MLKEDTWVVLDNEGPCTLNDNAQESMVKMAELCGIGNKIGAEFYRNISNIDDIWGDYHRIPEDPTYSSGHTLKVILPFLKAMGADKKWLYDFARENLRVVPHIGEAINDLGREYNTWMISTSYDFFIKAFCDKIGFDFNRADCTAVGEFDKIPISDFEKKMLLDFILEVSRMPSIEYDKATGVVIPEHQAFYDKITQFVWHTVYHLPVGEFIRNVHPVGQTQKKEALERVCKRFNVPLHRAMYVGDSQTDVQCVEFLKGIGLSMMFNGKGKAFRSSDIIYIGEDARAIVEVAEMFCESGRSGVTEALFSQRQSKFGGLLAKIPSEKICVDHLEKISIKKRKEFRGVQIGELT